MGLLGSLILGLLLGVFGSVGGLSLGLLFGDCCLLSILDFSDSLLGQCFFIFGSGGLHLFDGVEGDTFNSSFESDCLLLL